MSTLPPEPPQSAPPPPPPPPPPAGTAAGSGLPWENRAQLGFGPAFVETVKLVVTAPGQTFAQMKERGDLFEALLFGIIPAWIGAVFYSIWSMMFATSWLAMMPEQFRERFGALAGFGAGSFVFRVIFAPVFITIGLFIASGILHLCLMIVGGLSQSKAGFEGTFRTICYASVADFAQLVPFVGGLVAAVWKLVLLVIGLATVHKTTQGKAIFAVLIPLILCCGCFLVLGATILALIGGAMAHR